MRPRFPIVAAAAALAVASVAAAQPAPARPDAPPPNIVLVVADDLGYGDLPAFGHRVIRTPALDRLAAEGLRFTNYYAASPLCSPSRAAMMTGRTPFRTGIQSWIPPAADMQLGPREVTIATLLARRGYQTLLSGKWHLNGGLDVAAHAQPDAHGFQHWLALHGWAEPHHQNPTNFFRNGRAAGRIEGFAAQIVVDEALAWLERRRRDQPFFIYLAFAEPHSTIANPPAFNAQYAAYTDGVPDPMANGAEPPTNIAARGPGEYFANITHLDHHLGRVLEYLDRAGLRDNTVVIFTSDNGPVTTDWRQWYEVNLYGSTGGLRGRKGDLFDGGIRVPAIVRWPGRVAPGTSTPAPSIGYDLLPTLAAITGAPLPDDRPIDGESLLPVLDGKAWTRQQPLYWEFDDLYGNHFAARDGRWKIIVSPDWQRVQLFDLERDRFEVINRAAAEPAVVARLLTWMRARHASVVADPLRPALPALR